MVNYQSDINLGTQLVENNAPPETRQDCGRSSKVDNSGNQMGGSDIDEKCYMAQQVAHQQQIRSDQWFVDDQLAHKSGQSPE